jgi:hypothetical protein
MEIIKSCSGVLAGVLGDPGCRVIRRSSPVDPERTSLIGRSDRSNWCGLGATRVACSTAFLGRFQWLFVPRICSTSVATWSWQTWVVKPEKCFGQVVFILLEKTSPSRLPFTPPSLVASSILQFGAPVGRLKEQGCQFSGDAGQLKEGGH